MNTNSHLQERQSIFSSIEAWVPPGILNFSIHIVGCGALGTAIAELLVRSSASKITLYDPDTVEYRNLATQKYSQVDYQAPKVAALKNRLTGEIPGLEIITHEDGYTDQPLDDVVIAVTDNLESRRQVWQACQQNPDVLLNIDARTHGPSANIFCIRTHDPDDSEFFSRQFGESAPEPTCSHPFLPNMVAVTIAENLLLWASHKSYGRRTILQIGSTMKIGQIDFIQP